MKRTLKKFLDAKMPTFICTILLLFFIFIANGYGILETRLNINGKASIVTENNPNLETWIPEIKFIKTHQMGNSVFFYDIIIDNDSNKNSQNWQIKIIDTQYISYPYSIDGKREGNSWIINNLNWDDRLDSGDRVYATIIFEVSSDLPSSMDVTNCVNNFLGNSIKITASDKSNREGKIISNKNATLTLNESEIEIKDFTVKRDMEYVAKNPNERQYILTINNTSDYDYKNIRGNIYLGSENKMLEVSPSEITCVHLTNTTFILPTWLSILKGDSSVVYFMVTTEDENFVPDIVLSATI